MTKVSQASWDEIYVGHFVVDVEGWLISIYNDCDELDYCEAAIAPDGRSEVFLAWESTSQEPVRLLKNSERQVV